MWINRAVGLADSANWQFIEYFISAYRFSALISLPYLLDIPANTEVAVTMRLDCDEDILSAVPLYEMYQEKKVPFSLAIKTSLPIADKEIAFLKKLKRDGGAILSHSVNHKVAWGKDYADAFEEALLSKAFLEKILDVSVEYAVSPFHSNAVYSVKAMEDAQYSGFISGIIANDPEYLMARGGHVPFSENIISHSQQCMLHGDCLLASDDPLRLYKKSFDIAHRAETFFGFLDHPFSPRYQYGWDTEWQRINAHRELIDYMRYHADILFVNEATCLDFMIDKSNTEITYDNKIQIHNRQSKKTVFPIGVSLNNQVYSQ